MRRKAWFETDCARLVPAHTRRSTDLNGVGDFREIGIASVLRSAIFLAFSVQMTRKNPTPTMLKIRHTTAAKWDLGMHKHAVSTNYDPVDPTITLETCFCGLLRISSVTCFYHVNCRVKPRALVCWPPKLRTDQIHPRAVPRYRRINQPSTKSTSACFSAKNHNHSSHAVTCRTRTVGQSDTKQSVPQPRALLPGRRLA